MRHAVWCRAGLPADERMVHPPMSGGIRSRRILVGCVTVLSLALTARGVWADTVWLRSGTAANALERPNVKVEKIENNLLFFRSSQSDRVTERPLEEVLRIAA